jgi:hypothetical protein
LDLDPWHWRKLFPNRTIKTARLHFLMAKSGLSPCERVSTHEDHPNAPLQTSNIRLALTSFDQVFGKGGQSHGSHSCKRRLRKAQH